MDDTHRSERLQPCPDGRTADANLPHEVAFRRQPIARTQASALDQAAHVADDLLRAPFRGDGNRIAILGMRSHDWSYHSC